MATAAGSGPHVRRSYIDWLRGLAVLFMILWHVVDAWQVADGRETAAFGAIVFVAGWAAPMFLFLAGLSLPLAGQTHMARGRDRASAARALMTRGWQVFLLAHLFRFQSFLLSPNAAWNGLLKPDILNILGLGLVMAAFGWGRAVSWRQRCWWLLAPAVVVAFVLTPWVHDWWWPSLLHPRLEGYIRVVGGNAVFSLFPAVAYVFAGAFVGSLLADTTPGTEARFLARGATVGLLMLALSIGSAFVPLGPDVQRWTGPALIAALRIGALLVALATVRAILARRGQSVARPMGVLGRASLVVYWVHVEVAYGNVSYPFHKALSLPWALAGFAVMTAAMYGLARWWTTKPTGRPLVPVHMVAPVPAAAWRSPAGGEAR